MAKKLVVLVKKRELINPQLGQSVLNHGHGYDAHWVVIESCNVTKGNQGTEPLVADLKSLLVFVSFWAQFAKSVTIGHE